MENWQRRKGWRLFVKIFGLFFLIPCVLWAESAVVSWQPNTEPDLAGYQIYYGTTSRFYSVIIDVGNTTQYTVTGLNPGVTYYFAVTAYDINGNESDYSEEVSYQVLDTTPPTVTQAVCEQADKVKVVFSEPVEKASAELASNYSIAPTSSYSISQPIVVLRAELQSDGKTVYLYTTQHPSAYYNLTINNVRDCASVPNTILSNTRVVYSWEGGDNVPPRIVSAELYRRDFLVLTFNEAITQTSALTLSNYSISPSIQILSAGIDGSFTKVYLTTAAHSPGQTYTLTVNNIKDCATVPNTIAANTTVTYTCTSGDAEPPIPVAARLATSTQLQIEFNEKLDVASAQTIVNYTITPSVRILSATLNTEKTVVTLSTDPHSAGTYTVTVKNVGDANTPSNYLSSAQLSYSYTPPDVTPPTVAQVSLVGNNLLMVKYSEPVDRTTAEQISNYSITPSVQILSAILDVTQTQVMLQTNPHPAGNFTLKISGIKDLANVPNLIASNTSVTYSYTPSDVTPPGILSVTLHGATLLELVFTEALDRTSAETASNYKINNGIAVSSASLVGENLDRVYLTTSSHQPGQSYTITVSGIRDRATAPNVMPVPVQVNYTYPYVDTTPPRLISASLIGGNQFLELTFSEPLLRSSAEVPTNYNISNGIQVEKATLDASGTKVFLKTSAHTFGMTYTVTVRNVMDLATPGNVIGSENQAAYTCVSQDALPPQLLHVELLGDRTLELMFNEPVDLNSAITKSNYSISNGISVLAVSISSSQMNVFLQTTPHVQGTYTLTVSGIKDLASNTLSQAQKTYAYYPPDDSAPVLLQVVPVNETMLELVFNEPLDRASAEDVSHYTVSGGIVVERAILDASMIKVYLQTTRQYPGTYEVTVQGVKDASANANPIMTSAKAQYTFSPMDRTPPTIVSAYLQTETMLVVNFSEALDRITAENKANYVINNGIQVKTAFLSAYDTQVILETSPHSAGEYTLTVNGVQDASPQKNAIAAYSQMKYVWNPPDTVGPKLLSAKLHTANMLQLTFSEALEANEAKKTENYQILPRVEVLNAVLDETLCNVFLYTEAHQQGTYIITVMNVKDRAFQPNRIGKENACQYTWVPPDTTPPQLVAVSLRTPMSLVLTFSEPLARDQAENVANYVVEPGIEVKQASLLASLTEVHLETSTHQAQVQYTIRVTGLRDRAPVANTIKKPVTGTYTYVPPDVTPPQLLDGKLQGANLLELVFSEPLEVSSAENRNNYQIDPYVEVLNVTLDPSSPNKVFLETTAHIPGVAYSINVRNVRDRAPLPNTISPSTWWSYSMAAAGTFADRTPPALARVDLISSTQIDLIFTEPISLTSGENKANYIIQDSVTVQSVKLDSDMVRVHLTTSPHRLGKMYHISVRNIADRAAQPNILSLSSGVKYMLGNGISVSHPSRPNYGLALFRLGAKAYVDRDYTIQKAPALLEGAIQILTSNDDKTATETQFFSFELYGDGVVYVAYDKAISTVPEWLSSWKLCADQVMDSRSNVYRLYSKHVSGGRVTLGGNMAGMDQNMYLVFVAPSLANRSLLAKINRASYDIGHVEIGDPYYVDRAYTIASMPDSLSGYLWIRTANDDKTSHDAEFLSFTLTAKSEVIVAYDAQISVLPNWFKGWEKKAAKIIDSRGEQFDLYAKVYDKGEVVLGGNCGSAEDNMYFVLLKPLEPQGKDRGISELPGYFTLSQNYPNPFNPKTTIAYVIHKDGRVKITVFNLLGQKVKVLLDEECKAGTSGTVEWDGTDMHGMPVASGMYFYRIEQNMLAKTRRMILMR